MKRSYEFFNNEKKKTKQWKQEHDHGGFRCAHCKRWVVINLFMGTANRNHCNLCLWSKHVDVKKGDRAATCHAGMAPIGLIFKHEGWNRQGEAMLIHKCAICNHVSINRIAADDDDVVILAAFERSCSMTKDARAVLQKQGIVPLNRLDYETLRAQLFGFSHS